MIQKEKQLRLFATQVIAYILLAVIFFFLERQFNFTRVSLSCKVLRSNPEPSSSASTPLLRRQILGQYINLGQDRILPYPFKLIIYQLYYH